MATQPGFRRTLVYLIPDSSNINETAVPSNSLIVSLMGNAANYLVQASPWRYIQYWTNFGITPTNNNAIEYTFLLTTTGDALFTAANLATLQSQLGVSSIPTWTEAITFGS